MKKLMKKLAAAVMAAVITASAMVIPTTTASAAGVFDGAKKMEALEYYSGSVDTDEYMYYKIVLSKSGDLTFRTGNWSSNGDYGKMQCRLYNTNAEQLAWWNYGENTINNLNKGTYYLRVLGVNLYNNVCDVTYKDLYYTFTPDQKPTISLKLTVTKGDTIQLGSVVENYDGKVTWESTKTKVAEVSTKGKVTAKKKGTATIRAKLDSGEYVQIKIVVKNPTKK